MTSATPATVKPAITLSYIRAGLEHKLRKDPQFRERFAADPDKAFTDLTGLSLPQGFQIKLIDNHVYLEVPEDCLHASDWAVAVVESDRWRIVVSHAEASK